MNRKQQKKKNNVCGEMQKKIKGATRESNKTQIMQKSCNPRSCEQ